MKLRNKKTGEIALFENAVDIHDKLVVSTKDGFKYYNSLAELNEEWEDYEEPKEYWYLDNNGDVDSFRWHGDDYDKRMMLIGNCFSSKEEAEKVVEKLKAWKRLKDYNLKFNLDFVKNKIGFTYSINNPLLNVLDGEEQIFNNMKIVFGGEDE